MSENIEGTIVIDKDEIEGDGFKRTKPNSPQLMVAKKTPPKRLSKAIVGCITEHAYCELLCVMERALFQATKAIIIAAAQLKTVGIDVYFVPSFMEPRPVIDGKIYTGVRVSIYPFQNDLSAAVAAATVTKNGENNSINTIEGV